MRYLDYLFAWILLVTAAVFIVVTETYHLGGAILDIPFLWIIIAAINFLRLRNVQVDVRGLRTCCVGANLIGFTLEAVRLKLFGGVILRNWGPYTLVALVAIFGELVFSVLPKNDTRSTA